MKMKLSIAQSLSVTTAFLWLGMSTQVQAVPDTSVSGMLNNASTAQVSSVSELSDVDPNNWAFQALKSLVERYGCIEGYPSKKYLGNRPLSRYEFAAGLNACLDKVGEQIAAATEPLATKDDLAAVQRLQEEFKAELDTLKGRTDALEAKTKELEAHQFSTTTKLDGSVVFNITGGSAGGGNVVSNRFSSPDPAVTPGPIIPGNAANTTFTGRTTLNFRTSFTGKDQLRIRVRGFTGSDISQTLGAGTGVGTLFTSGTNPNSNGTSTATFDKVYYTTPIFADNVRIWVGPKLQGIDIIDGNRFAGGDDENTFSTVMHSYSPLLSGIVHSGPGAAFDWKISDQFSFRGLYMAANGGQSFGFGNGGITGGTNKVSAELEFRPSQDAAIRLQYAYINAQNTGGNSTIFGGGTNAVLVGTDPTFAFVGAGGARNAQTSVFGVNADWAITPSVGIFGRFATGDTSIPGGSGNVTSNSYHVGFAFPDLFAKGNLAGVAYGQPIRITGSPVGTDSGTENDLELFYKIQINPRFSITPDLQFYFTPGSVAGNPTVTVGTLRASYQF
jgi:Carbohydrate-selective porin, OprB family/S-layer homology domain